MTKITYPLSVDLDDNRHIVCDGESLYRVDDTPGAFCPCETRYPQKGNWLLYIALLSPDILGSDGATTPARRAEWSFNLSHERARRLMLKLQPRIVQIVASIS